MNIKIKKLHEQAVIPSYSKEGDCGLDLTAISVSTIDKSRFGYIEYDTGLAIEIPEGYVGLVYPRSSLSNTGLILANHVGVIDQNYRGSIKCRFKAIPGTDIYSVGDRIAQLIIQPCPKIEFEVVDELSDTNRNDLGFGSSGK
jgi:dUTP pyrophosphatase